MRIGTDQLSNRIEKKIKMVCFFFPKVIRYVRDVN